MIVFLAKVAAGTSRIEACAQNSNGYLDALLHQIVQALLDLPGMDSSVQNLFLG
ncbi:hypothetical protein M378DRAFT_154885 [Amanita muscaria Koide BX008]|uniref:Uncharacterized protein n=1 Tax=Amanita muscaria (strain Koide BX008) TaxID=946122 RepID=A0A0C2XAB7_AMAMK|nr:hypothetical protein M378DRAFT_154885 [Amanita muscaria Koide BX008]